METNDNLEVTRLLGKRGTLRLTVEPQSPVFTGESVTLKCEVQGYDAWTYQWYKKKAQSQWTTVSQSVFDTVNRDTLTISRDAVVNGDQYQCRGARNNRPTTSQYSNTVTLTVHVKPTPELTSSLKGAALVGNPVTLHCKLDQSAGWSFYWSRHTQNPENETNTAANSYNISSVAPSDGGQYWCRAGRGNPVYYTNYSDAIWVNVTALSHSEAPFSILSRLSSLLAVSPYLLVSIVLGVKCYRAHALTETRSQNAVSEE
ncbi:basement membrane-specific heparan sulfate proteoglycan core protein-like [Electrophorus electricus]|uniref:basement membrane-specific heparan sulfate proteoglycan core protein-like n=1 Tax=Electrophorus electricus TaxID=8005 RepID=UPI0015D089A0|nr:basement membrane-specific heparan sulfate proteoglycan core protein-like [Electrophorus electricus]